MAALRRLLHRLSNAPGAGTFTAQGRQATPRATKALTAVAAGAGVTAAVYYFWPSVGRGSGLRSHVEAQLFHLALPSVSATDNKVQCDIFFFFFFSSCAAFFDDIHLARSQAISAFISLRFLSRDYGPIGRALRAPRII